MGARYQRDLPDLRCTFGRPRRVALPRMRILNSPDAFAGLWTRWRGVRGPKSAPVEGEHELFGFLTTEANVVVAPIHPKAMPVVLTITEEFDLWLEGESRRAHQ
jgi:putative SOS response-associated peptidase YedK